MRLHRGYLRRATSRAWARTPKHHGMRSILAAALTGAFVVLSIGTAAAGDRGPQRDELVTAVRAPALRARWTDRRAAYQHVVDRARVPLGDQPREIAVHRRRAARGYGDVGRGERAGAGREERGASAARKERAGECCREDQTHRAGFVAPAQAPLAGRRK